jgi:hypothetical protein
MINVRFNYAWPKSQRISPRYTSRAHGATAMKGENDCEADRDERVLALVRGKQATQVAQARRAAPLAASFAGARTHRRMVSVKLAPSREDETKFVAVPGRYVPVGFARYVQPMVSPLTYNYYRVAGWRVAIPRGTTGDAAKNILHRIHLYGPQSVGYARVGDTLVPATLETEEMLTVAEADGSRELPLGQ